MLLISYDISETKLRTRFSKMLIKNGCVRLQFSVYELNNTNRNIDNLLVKIQMTIAKEFSGEDSVMIFDVDKAKVKKYGNAIHQDKPIVFL